MVNRLEKKKFQATENEMKIYEIWEATRRMFGNFLLLSRCLEFFAFFCVFFHDRTYYMVQR